MFPGKFGVGIASPFQTRHYSRNGGVVLADCRYRSESALRKHSCYHELFSGEAEFMPNYRRNFVPGGSYFLP
jgi:hypothetical protein